jgi:glycosyltransferase involved in cell wall biosynthesis
MVAGTKSVNHTLKMARGDFVTHLDDDDEYLPNRLRALLEVAQNRRLGLVWHPFYFETDQGWQVRDCLKFEKGSITTSSSFYHGWLARIPWNPHAYRFYEPGDWNRFRKFRYLGVPAARHEGILLRHYRERNQAQQSTATGTA